MRRSLFHQNNYNLPQNYHYQQMNGQQLVNHQSPAPHCDCIKLSVCNPVMNMARQMYTGFIADYINSQLQVIACNFIDGEMAVCCPKNPYQANNKVPDSREKRGNGSSRLGQFTNDGDWNWGSEDSSLEDNDYPPPQKYPQKQFTSYPIQGFYPYANNPFLKNIHKSPFYANHEDPSSMKNCPPPFSEEFKLPKNHTFFKEPKVQTTTAAPRVEVTTKQVTSAPESLIQITPEMQAKMHLINDETCGRSVGSRIIGGQDAGVGRFSWMARLAYRNKSILIIWQKIKNCKWNIFQVPAESHIVALGR